MNKQEKIEALHECGRLIREVAEAAGFEEFIVIWGAAWTDEDGEGHITTGHWKTEMDVDNLRSIVFQLVGELYVGEVESEENDEDFIDS